MSDETAKPEAVVRRIYEELNRGNLDIFDELLSPDYLRHCQAMPPRLQEIRGISTFKSFLVEHLSAFPDWKEEIEFTISEGDRIAYVATGAGTQTGPLGPSRRRAGKPR